jgi:hypothetical protein
MAARNPQTHAKRARELAVKEKRDRKRARKAERAAGGAPETPADAVDDGSRTNVEDVRD